MENISNIPQHVAIILDGNGRWAKAKGMPRNYGHMQGAKAVEDILVDARDIGIKYLTVYAFSTENWTRPEAEVSALMTILRNYLKTSIKKSMKNNVRCRVIGDKSGLSEDIQEAIRELEEATAGNTGLTFTIAINYGSRDEITRAVRKVAEKVQNGEITAAAVEDILVDARDIGIKYLTVYAFSTENWTRPEAEVSALMTILRNYLKTSIKKSMKNNVRCRVIGDKSGLSEDIQEAIRELEEATAGNTGLTFTIAINYGSRDEITRAVRKVAEKVQNGEITAADITQDMIAENLDTNYLPDPDLLIRTCNEQRISNYLLWQCAYSEFYFTEVAWPDFDKEQLLKAVEAYGNRTRKFGGLKTEQ